MPSWISLKVRVHHDVSPASPTWIAESILDPDDNELLILREVTQNHLNLLHRLQLNQSSDHIADSCGVQIGRVAMW